VVLTAKPGTARCDGTLSGGAVAALQQFELTVEVLSSSSSAAASASSSWAAAAAAASEEEEGKAWEPAAQIVVTTSRELRSALTLRQILDDGRDSWHFSLSLFAVKAQIDDSQYGPRNHPCNQSSDTRE
jgi:hypothetical protein